MGNQHPSRSKNIEPSLSEIEVQRLLEAQRKLYEKKCQQYMKQAQNAQNVQAQTSQSPLHPPTQAAGMARPPQCDLKVQRLLDEQRELYEKMRKDFLTKQQSAQNASAQTPQSQAPCPPPRPPAPAPTATAPPAVAPPATAPPALASPAPPALATPAPVALTAAPSAQPMQNFTQAASMTSVERNHCAPYSVVREDLQKVKQTSTATAPHLYPNLNNPGPSSMTSAVPTFWNRSNQNPTPSQQNLNPNRIRPSAPPQPNRSRSVSRFRNTSNDDEVNCPTCKTMFGLQIYQCSSGHSSCDTCKKYGRPCGICGNEITTMRNITLEGYMAERKVPCQNKAYGFRLAIKMADMEFHVRECPFNKVQCTLKCLWTGPLRQLSGHFDAHHPEQRTAEVDSEIRLQNITNYSQNLYLVLIGAFNFLFHVKVSEGKIYMTVQLIGTKMSAAKWSYEVHVYNKNECRRKYTYTDVCGSFIEPVADVFREGRCSFLPPAYASTFVNNGAITYKFSIKKNIEGNPRGECKNWRKRGSP